MEYPDHLGKLPVACAYIQNMRSRRDQPLQFVRQHPYATLENDRFVYSSD